MGKRSGSGSSILGAVFVIGLAVWVLSQIWAYLLISGAVILLGWIGWAAVRTLQPLASTPRLVAVETPRLAPAPHEQYSVLTPMDPKVFDNPPLAEAAALKVFSVWAQALPMAPAELSGVVRSLELRVRRIGRLVTEVGKRRAAWREVSHTGSDQASAPTVTIETIDPWSKSPEELRRNSFHVSSCSRCAGVGQSTCGNCNGTSSARCSACSGAGKAYGYAANGSYRLLNCKMCRGKGNLKCTSCVKGKVTCSTCTGTGRVERWIEIEETVRHDVQIEPDGEMTRAFRWGTDGTSATRAEVEADAKIITELTAESALAYAQFTAQVPAEWLAANWQKIQPALDTQEGVRRQTFWLLEVPSIELSYALAGFPESVISFEGLRMLAPSPSTDTQFTKRAQRIRLVRNASIGLGVAVPLAYLFRGTYFFSGWVAALAGCMAGIALTVTGFIREATLGRQSARRWAVGVAAAAVLACGFALGAEPSLRAANRYITAQQFEQARAELKALGRPEVATHAQTWANLNLTELLQSSDVATIKSGAAQIPASWPQRAAADRHLYEVASHSAAQQLAEGKPEASEELLAQTESAFSASADGNVYRSGIAELHAQAQERKAEKCKTDICRWQSAATAAQAATTLTRQQRVIDARAKLVAAMEFHEQPGESTLSRIQRLNQISASAQAIEEGAGDEALVAQARSIGRWAAEERGKTPVLGAERELAAELLGVPARSSAGLLNTTVSRVAVYGALRGNRCVGMYLVGDEKDARVLNDSIHATATARLFSQAFGRKVELPDVPKLVGGRMPSLTKWIEGGTTITARWKRSALVELRIGEITP